MAQLQVQEPEKLQLHMQEITAIKVLREASRANVQAEH
jgi:hypothetical protein